MEICVANYKVIINDGTTTTTKLFMSDVYGNFTNTAKDNYIHYMLREMAKAGADDISIDASKIIGRN